MEHKPHPSSYPPTTPINLPHRKRDFEHLESSISPSLHPKSQKTTLTAGRTRDFMNSMDDILSSDNLGGIAVRGVDTASRYIARQQHSRATQSLHDRELSGRIPLQHASRQRQHFDSENPDPPPDSQQKIMSNTRKIVAPTVGFNSKDSDDPKVDDRVYENGINNPGEPIGGGSMQLSRNFFILRSLQEQQRQYNESHSQKRMLQPVWLPDILPGSDFSSTSQHRRPATQQSPPLPESTTGRKISGMGSTSTINDIISRTSTFSYADAASGSSQAPTFDRMKQCLGSTQDQQKMTDKELEELLGNIRPDQEIPLGKRQEKLDGLKVNIYHHQQVALKWMEAMEDGSNKGGILADDMGLGKTISALALMVTRRASTRPKTNLIIGPLSLIRQWENEIRTKTSASHQMSVFVYHNRKTTTDELLTFDVVLTTYGTIAAEHKRLEAFLKEKSGAERSAEYNHSQTMARFPLLHPTRARYHRVILDEAQCIKNKETQTAKACRRLRANYRWCLTGTPIMNGVLELYSLLAFLHIKPYCVWDRFCQQFGILFGRSGAEKTAAMTKMRALLKAIMLRRKKNSLLDGKPILQLPPKTEQIVHAKLSSDEHDYYSQLEVKAQVLFSKYLREGSIGKNYSNILVLLLRLRQSCCHPHLNLDVSDSVSVTEDEASNLIQQLEPSIVARIKTANGFECPVCYDVVLSPQFFFPCGHESCSQCFSRIADTEATRITHEGHDSGNNKCPVCRGQFNSKQCFSLEAFKKVHMPDELKEESGDETETGSDEDYIVEDADASDDDLNSDNNLGATSSLSNFVVDDHYLSTSEDDMDSKPFGVKTKTEGSPAGSKFEIEAKHGKETLLIRKAKIKQGKQIQRIKAKQHEKNKSRLKTRKNDGTQTDVKPSMLKELRIEARKNREAYHKYMDYLRQNWLPSAKVTECIRLLKEAEAQGRKSIVFSQWTLLLDLIEVGLHNAGFKNAPLRYDGGMSGEVRNAVTTAFQNPARKDVTVMLISLRAGNAGLNLTEATRVIIMDPFWNPYTERQAIDRAYRIGQRQRVEVFRILTQETVEDRIVELKEKKQAIVEAALDEAESAKIARLGVSELKFLFNRSDE